MTDSKLPPPVTAHGTVYSPSPKAGTSHPARRQADKKSYAIQWTTVGMGLLLWSISFFNEIAQLSWPEITTLKFVAGHAAQVLGVIAAVLGARQIKN